MWRAVACLATDHGVLWARTDVQVAREQIPALMMLVVPHQLWSRGSSLHPGRTSLPLAASLKLEYHVQVSR